MSYFLQLATSASTCFCAIASGHGSDSRPMEGTEGSMVAIVRFGFLTLRPRDCNPLKACGEVTSCIRCRSMYSNAGSSAASRTMCASHIFSYRVLLLVFLVFFIG